MTANDEQTCTDLCNSCQGTASFVDGLCECYVANANPEGNEKRREKPLKLIVSFDFIIQFFMDFYSSGDECMQRIKRQADERGLNFVDCEAANGDRPARCSCLKTYKRCKTGNYQWIHYSLWWYIQGSHKVWHSGKGREFVLV